MKSQSRFSIFNHEIDTDAKVVQSFQRYPL